MANALHLTPNKLNVSQKSKMKHSHANKIDSIVKTDTTL